MMKVIKLIRYTVSVAVSAVVLFAAARICICDRFVIKGRSMEPTFTTGDKVYVNKLIMGARIYTSLDFESGNLRCFRMPALGHLKRGDIVVFNSPEGQEKEHISFKVNYVYCKRCVGCPGDTLEVRNGLYYINGHRCDCMPSTMQDMLAGTPDSLLKRNKVALHAMAYRTTGWTIKDFGPMMIPSRGDELKLDSISRVVYRKALEYETGRPVSELKDSIYLFPDNWYFLAGDNVIDSKDSRYFGLVPEDYIVGVVAGKARR